MAYLITVTDLETGQTEEFVHDNIERTVQTGRVRLDANGPGTPVVVPTGDKTLLIKAFTGDIQTYEDFVLYNDETNGEPGDADEAQGGSGGI